MLLYFSLKAFGIFHSPPFAEFVTVLSAGYFVGKTMTHLQLDVKDLKKDVTVLKSDMVLVKKDLTRLNEGVFPSVS